MWQSMKHASLGRQLPGQDDTASPSASLQYLQETVFLLICHISTRTLLVNEAGHIRAACTRLDD